MSRQGPSIDQVLADARLLAASLGDLATWRTWRIALKAAFGLPLSAAELTTFKAIAGDRAPPSRRVRELWTLAGRRSGKSRMAAAIAAYSASCVNYRSSRLLAPGETGMVLVLAPTVDQAKIIFGYTRAFLEKSPVLCQLIEAVTADEIRLRGDVAIGVHAASYRSIRGRTLLACIFDESAMWRDETSANPDLEIYRAVLPALTTTRGMLIGIGTPYRRLGLLYTRWRDHFGKDDPDVLVVHGPTTAFNPTIDTELIAQAERDDPAAALTEWQAQFRTDLLSFLDDASIDAAVNHSRPLELPPRAGVRYHTFTDASAGRHDAYTICISHREGERAIADVVRGTKPPFDPMSVTEQFAELARQYRCGSVTGDAYAAEWVQGAWRKAGIGYKQSELNRSELYLEGLPIFTRGLTEIPNHQALLRELRLLERRTHRSGRDSVDHGAGGSDDFANALFGAIHLAVAKRAPMQISDNVLQWSRTRHGPALYLRRFNPPPAGPGLGSISFSDHAERGSPSPPSTGAGFGSVSYSDASDAQRRR